MRSKVNRTAATMIIAGALCMGTHTNAMAQSTISRSTANVATQSSSDDGVQLAMKDRADVFYRDAAASDGGVSALAVPRSRATDRAPRFTLLDEASTARLLRFDSVTKDYLAKEVALDEHSSASKQTGPRPLFNVSVGGWELPVFMGSKAPTE